MPDIALQLETIRRGCDELLIEAELVEKLKKRHAAAHQSRF